MYIHVYTCVQVRIHVYTCIYIPYTHIRVYTYAHAHIFVYKRTCSTSSRLAPEDMTRTSRLTMAGVFKTLPAVQYSTPVYYLLASSPVPRGDGLQLLLVPTSTVLYVKNREILGSQRSFKLEAGSASAVIISKNTGSCHPSPISVPNCSRRKRQGSGSEMHSAVRSGLAVLFLGALVCAVLLLRQVFSFLPLLDCLFSQNQPSTVNELLQLLTLCLAARRSRDRGTCSETSLSLAGPCHCVS
jgi:hypothetical protein